MSNCTTVEPSSAEFFAYIKGNASAILLLTFMSIFCVITVAIYIEALYYIEKKVLDSRTRVRLTVILGIYPVYSCASLLALFIPKSHLITYLSSTLYFSVALYQFMMLAMDYFGGRDQLLIKLQATKIPIASPPLFCCCPCIPPAEMTAKNLFRLRRLVLQTAIIRPLCNFISLILWADGTYILGDFSAGSAYVWLTTMALASTIVAFYGVIVVMRISDKALDGYKIKPKFLLVQLVLVLISLQLVIIGSFALTGYISCEYPMPVLTRSYYISDILTVVEMLIFIVLARFYFRKRIHRTPAGRDHPDHRFSITSIAKDSFPADPKKDLAIANADTPHPDYQVKTTNGDAKYISTNNNHSDGVVNMGIDDVDIDVDVHSYDVTDRDETSMEVTI